jgi:hypothetical protein
MKQLRLEQREIEIYGHSNFPPRSAAPPLLALLFLALRVVKTRKFQFHQLRGFIFIFGGVYRLCPLTASNAPNRSQARDLCDPLEHFSIDTIPLIQLNPD